MLPTKSLFPNYKKTTHPAENILVPSMINQQVPSNVSNIIIIIIIYRHPLLYELNILIIQI